MAVILDAEALAAEMMARLDAGETDIALLEAARQLIVDAEWTLPKLEGNEPKRITH